MTRNKTITGWLVAAVVTVMPTIVQAGPGPYFVQDHFRWRNDNGDAASATWKTAADTTVGNVPHYQNIRLRFSISNRGEGYGSLYSSLEYATAANGPWAPVAPSSGGAFAFEFSDSTWFTNGALAGNLLTGTGTFTNAGQMVECDNGNGEVNASVPSSMYMNTEVCFRPTAKAKGGVTYYFRLYSLSLGVNCSQYAALTMEAYDPPEPPKIVSPLSGVTVSVEKVGYSLNDLPEKTYRILASGSDPITYEATGLPSGYALFGDTIADDGTPSTPGTYSVTLTVRNTYGSDTKTLTLAVADNQAPAYRTLVSGEVGKPFRFDIPVAGTAPITCRMQVVGGGGLPAGLSFDGVRTISGTPQAPGRTRLLMTAVNAANKSTADVNQAPAMRVILTITGSGVADADGDGMTDSWEIQYFGSTSLPAGGPDQDADGDGMTNLAEFTAGTNPTDAASVLAVGAVGTAGTPDKFVVSWQSVSGKNYGVDKNTDLSSGAWQPVAAGLPGTPPVNTYTDTVDTVGTVPAGYYRVKVE